MNRLPRITPGDVAGAASLAIFTLFLFGGLSL